MGRAPGSGLLKWGIVPILCALLGYAFVGPHFAVRTKTGAKLAEEVAKVLHRPETPPPPAEPQPAPRERNDATPAPAPIVSVGVKPVDASEPDEAPAPRPRWRRRRRHRTVTTDEAPPEAIPEAPERTAPDPASTP